MGKLLVPFSGVIEIVGEHDTGKTIAALQVVYPFDNTVFIDDDVKGDATVKQIVRMEGKRKPEDVFGAYYDLRKMRAKAGAGKTPATPTQLLEKVVDPVVEEIIKTKHDVIVWDTGRIIYQSARGHVEKNQVQYRDVVKFQGNSQIVQGLISRVARMVELNYLSKLRDACDILVVTHHIKDWYANNVVVGVIPESSSTYSEICTMRMWLRRNPSSKVPIVLFLKRPNIPVAPKGGKQKRARFVNIVPPKITPNGKDESIWDTIDRYVTDPVESRELRPDETPTKEEMTLISGTLSDDQKSFMVEVLKHQSVEKEQVSTIIKASSSSNGTEITSGAQLLMKAMKEYNMDDVHVAQVLEISEDDLMELEGEAANDAWQIVKEFAKSSGLE